MSSVIRNLYVNFLLRLTRAELKRIGDLERLPSKKEVQLFVDHMMIACINQETPAQRLGLGFYARAAHIIADASAGEVGNDRDSQTSP